MGDVIRFDSKNDDDKIKSPKITLKARAENVVRLLTSLKGRI
jgi:hypothetical protein